MGKVLYQGGPIITMNDRQMAAEAVLIENGIISRVGSMAYVRQYQDKHTDIVNLDGRAMLPAFLDAHSHITQFASSLDMVSLENVSSWDEIAEKLLNRLQSYLSPGEWICGFGYDHNQMKESRHPTRTFLDTISREHPIFIAHASGHMGTANSLALKMLGVTSHSDDPDGGKIGREEGTSEPNGYLEENAFIQASNCIPQPDEDKQLDAFDRAQKIYASYGIASAQDGFVKEREWSLLKHANTKKHLILDVLAYAGLDGQQSTALDNREYRAIGRGRLRFGGYKIFLDGSPQGRTAWLSQPYQDAENGYAGYPVHKKEETCELVRTAAADGAQLLAHCNGDAAIAQFIGACRQSEAMRKLRPVAIHAQIVRRDQLDQMAELGIIPSFFIAHVYQWGDIHIKNLGWERASHISPARAAKERELSFTFHQDTPVLMPDMMHTVWCAVNRRTRGGVLLGEEERLDLISALKAVTIHVAYQNREEAYKGSIEEGKRADFVLLEENPLAVPPEKLKDIRILKTIKEGLTIFQRP